MLEVHAQVGDQHPCAHVHRGVRAEQRAAQPGRLDLQHVVAGLGNRHAHHLERLRPGCVDRRHLDATGLRVARQQRDLSRMHHARHAPRHGASIGIGVLPLLVPPGLRHPQFARRSPGFVVFPQTAVPADHLAWRGHAAGTQLAGHRAGCQLALHAPQCQRHRRLRAPFDDAEGRRGKTGQRWRVARAHGQRKAGCVGQRPCGRILQVGGQFQAQGRPLHAHRREDDLRDLLGQVVGIVVRPDGLGARAQQPRLHRQRARHRRREAQHHGAYRQARRLGALAFATELGGERRPHLEVEGLRLAGEHLRVALRADAAAPHQAHLRALRQGAFATQHQGVVRSLGGR